MPRVTHRRDFIDHFAKPHEQSGREGTVAEKLVAEPLQVEPGSGFHHLHRLPRQDQRASVSARRASHLWKDLQQRYRITVSVGVVSRRTNQRGIAVVAFNQNQQRVRLHAGQRAAWAPAD
jgi:hypothetical protein